MTYYTIRMYDRHSFAQLVKDSDKTIFVKFSATWCAPCKQIKQFVDKAFGDIQSKALCLEIDIDESVDLYAMLKMKRMVNGVPTILCYNSENDSIYPDDSISGTDIAAIQRFLDENLE